MIEDWMKQPEYILTELQIRRAMMIMNQDCEMDEDEYIEFGKELRSRPYNPEKLRCVLYPCEYIKEINKVNEYVFGKKELREGKDGE